MRENIYRVALSILFTALALLIAKNAIGQVTLDVLPRVTVVNPYKTQTFRVRFRITPHVDNREYTYAATCGAKLISVIAEIDREVWTLFEDLVVIEDCLFRVCYSRKGFSKLFCTEVKVPGG